ncbi:MAG: DNA-directed DNA polymerase II small subunit [Candidatus Saliniplasma sp.]
MIGMHEEILKKVTEKNTLISPRAWEYLERQDDPTSIVDSILEKDDLPFPIGRDTIKSFVEKGSGCEKTTETSTEVIREISDTSALCENIKVIRDITGNSTCTGVIDDFTKYFNNRYEKLRSILSKRRESNGVIDIASVKKRKGDAKVIAIVGDIYQTKNGNKILNLEDPTGTMRGFISAGNPAYDKDLLEDEVILAVGSVWEKRKDFDVTFSIDEIIRPGVPKIRPKNHNDFKGKIAFIGDIHVGSDTFLKEEWNRFAEWMNSDSKKARDIKYIIVSGDLIDGIGIFPNQEEELEILDIYEQYKEFARMIKELPEDVVILTIPGNHDISRNPEPQPCLPEDVQEMFPDNVKFYGNPAFIDIDGLKILIYHGRSINDLSDKLNHVDTDHPVTAMKEMMERRHLVPVYGEKTPIAPEGEDLLVIDELPDVFVTGHIHRTQVEDYHGTIMINSSTWQDQTEYQKMRDIQPDPAKVIVFDPTSNQITVKQFN